LVWTVSDGAFDPVWPLGGKGKTVEVDQTFIGKPDEIFVSGKGWQKKRGTATKRKVLTMVERKGRAVSVEDLTVGTLKTVIGKTVVLDSDLNADEAQHYKSIEEKLASHGAVNHSAEEYARREGGKLITTNTVEGFFGIFKRGMVGMYQHCSEQHLQKYLNEFDFRYSNRSALSVEDTERASLAVKCARWKRLTYKCQRGCVKLGRGRDGRNVAQLSKLSASNLRADRPYYKQFRFFCLDGCVSGHEGVPFVGAIEKSIAEPISFQLQISLTHYAVMYRLREIIQMRPHSLIKKFKPLKLNLLAWVNICASRMYQTTP
jgi:hypothetical protein